MKKQELGIKTLKIPETKIIPFPISKKWGFKGTNSPNPQNLHPPRPQNIPLLGIFKDETLKNPKIELIPIPKKSLKFVQALSQSPPHP